MSSVSSRNVATASLDMLVRLEKLLDSRSSEPWICRGLPTPTAVFPAIIDSEEEDGESELVRMRCTSIDKLSTRNKSRQDADLFLHLKDDLSEHVCQQIRALQMERLHVVYHDIDVSCLWSGQRLGQSPQFCLLFNVSVLI